MLGGLVPLTLDVTFYDGVPPLVPSLTYTVRTSVVTRYYIAMDWLPTAQALIDATFDGDEAHRVRMNRIVLVLITAGVDP